MTNATAYRTLFLGELVQLSGLSTGGSSAARAPVDSPFARDGKGRPTLRGTGLAGALFATARKIMVWPDAQLKQWREMPSRWRFFNSHPAASVTGFRQGVGLRQDTGTTAKGVLYDAEVIAPGTRWPFLLEVDTTDERGLEAEAIAAAALLEWQDGYCWLGSDVARGLGWMELANLQAVRLPLSSNERWPNSHDDPFVSARALASKGGVTNLNDIASAAEPAHATAHPGARQWRYLSVRGTLQAGPRADGYGVDILSVGGHDSGLNALNTDTLLAPSQQQQSFRAAFDPDFALATITDAAGSTVPYIPGSGLRGPLRHALSRLLRADDKTIADPNLRDARGTPESTETDDVGVLFGSLARSARLLISDALPQAGTQPVTAWLQHHAEDEFSAGVYGSSKFDRVAVIEGTFEWRMVIETDDAKLYSDLVALLDRLLALAQAGHLPIGSSKWRGAGWVRWSVEQKHSRLAGQRPAEKGQTA
jgi:CRISPR/Cas system CSM-associated protein Csm3 (group 7 of RAMP superfamily)